MGKQLTIDQKEGIAAEAAKMTGNRGEISRRLALKYSCSSITIRKYMNPISLKHQNREPFSEKEIKNIHKFYEVNSANSKTEKINSTALKFNRSPNAIRRIVNTGVNETSGKEKMFNYKQPFL